MVSLGRNFSTININIPQAIGEIFDGISEFLTPKVNGDTENEKKLELDFFKGIKNCLCVLFLTRTKKKNNY